MPHTRDPDGFNMLQLSMFARSKWYVLVLHRASNTSNPSETPVDLQLPSIHRYTESMREKVLDKEGERIL